MPEPDLERISQLAELLDHPELTYPSIQITGTNGKTTTARLVTELACAQGLSVGTFTSPHLTSVTERLSVCGIQISEEEFGEEYGRIRPYLDRVDGFGRPVTYFEALTALAFLWFSDKPVGLGVFEVGMGGRWDATNLVRGEVAVLCPVGLDHPELGDTVSAVAEEKAGIVKEGATAVVRRQRPEAMGVIAARARDVGAALVVEGDGFELTSRAQALRGQSITVHGIYRSYDDLFLPLFGEQAARNAGASIAACESLLGRALDEGAVRSALAASSSPGRLEVAGRKPLVVLDGAHNVDAASALAAALLEAFRWTRLHLVAGMFGDKDVEGVLGALAALAHRGYACSPPSERAAPPERVAAALSAAGVPEVRTFPSVASAVDEAREAAKEDDLILVTGSFYTVGAARPLFAGT